MINEVEEWYQYVPVFRRHMKKGKKIPGSVRKPTSNIIYICKSPFPKRPDVLFFNYPKYVGSDKHGVDSDHIKVYNQEQMINCPVLFKISETTNIYNSLVNSCKNAGMILVDEGWDWNLLWAGGAGTDAIKDMDKY